MWIIDIYLKYQSFTHDKFYLWIFVGIDFFDIPRRVCKLYPLNSVSNLSFVENKKTHLKDHIIGDKSSSSNAF